MKRRVFLFILCWAIMLETPNPAQAYRDQGSWKKSLHEKTIFFEDNVKERHNIEGTYPSSVRLNPPSYYVGPQDQAWKTIIETGKLPAGWVFDQGTTGLSNIAHTSSWTGCYLTAQAFRVAYLRDKYGTQSQQYRQAYERANEVIAGLRILTRVSGVPGYLARGIAYGHGISYEERQGVETRDLWAQGVGEYSYLRYRGGPSHHNYDHVFRGLGMYYFLAADKAQKKTIRSIVEDMSNWAHLANGMVVMHTDGKHVSTILIGGWGGIGGKDRPSGGSLMATTGLKIAYMITGNQKVKALYEKWVDRLGYRDHKLTKKSIMGAPRTNYDDTDHLLGDLYLLNLIEEDAELLKFYRKCVQDSWQVHKDDKMAWFNFIYHAVLGDEYGNLQGSLWNLQTFPTCRIFQPQMNSIRTDLAFYTNGGVLESLHPLPVYQRPSDNEYTWKQSPYKLDGWLSRIVHVVEISPHDPYVQLAADTSGQAYYSNTKGQIWHGLPALEDVHDFLFSTSYPWIIFAATQSGIYRSIDGTMNWEKVLDRPTYRLYLDTENDHVLYAVVQGAIYQSDDFGEQAMGTIWRSVSGPEVVGANPFFDIDPQGPKATVYMLTPEGLYWKKEDQTKWNNPPHHMRTYGFGKVNRIGGKPLQLRVSSGPTKRIFRSVELSVRNRKLPFVTFSEDRGQTWKPVLRELEPMVNWYTGTDKTVKTEGFDYRKAFDMLKQFPIKDLWVDPDEPDRWYGLMDTGIAVTNDAGKTWTQSSKGLDIPRTYAMWIPRHTTDIYVGTPAGLYVSQDRGVSWQQTPLILQSDANPHGQKEQAAVRAEIGGIGYLEAYWMGLYHGFITDEQAGTRWWEN